MHRVATCRYAMSLRIEVSDQGNRHESHPSRRAEAIVLYKNYANALASFASALHPAARVHRTRGSPVSVGSRPLLLQRRSILSTRLTTVVIAVLSCVSRVDCAFLITMRENAERVPPACGWDVAPTSSKSLNERHRRSTVTSRGISGR